MIDLPAGTRIWIAAGVTDTWPEPKTLRQAIRSCGEYSLGSQTSNSASSLVLNLWVIENNTTRLPITRPQRKRVIFPSGFCTSLS